MLRLAGLILALGAGARAGELRPFASKDLDALMAGRRTVVIQFHAENCEVCVRQRQALARIARGASRTDPVFLYAEHEREPDLRRQYGVTALSTLLVLRGDRVLGRVTGIFAEEEIRAFIHLSRMRSRAKPRARPKASFRPER